jgi:hypothetical protein
VLAADTRKGRLGAGRDGLDLVALALERPHEREADPFVVFGEQDPGHRRMVGPRLAAEAICRTFAWPWRGADRSTGTL